MKLKATSPNPTSSPAKSDSSPENPAIFLSVVSLFPSEVSIFPGGVSEMKLKATSPNPIPLPNRVIKPIPQ